MGEQCVAKQLRLDVAQLTDVGRKREHNEDNMAYVIPKDPQVMAHKGALLIVADGMGGHAAGEVASEIAVDTVSNAYYQDESDDVPAALLRAIQRANLAIHQRASENMLRSGMGTTCVAAVLRGNRAYIANVGDSRAYLVRRSQIRQISQDHSWVAEQVRAGLLTEEQARTHAQRNVITRSLGTKPEEEIDLFIEDLEEGDTLLLCCDGLSGMVSDEELLHTLEQFVPQESVYHLVERANEYGGVDNITAIVARVQEVGAEPPSVRQPVPVGGPELSKEDTARLFAPMGTPANVLTHKGDTLRPGGPFSYASGPLVSPEEDTAPQPVLKKKRQHGRLFAPTLVMLVLLLLVAGGGGFYYLLHVNQAQTVNQTLSSATRLINQAGSEVSTNPAQALQNLSSAQQQLQNVQKNYALSASQAATLTNLQNQLVSETKTAITTYNKQANIAALPCTSTSARPDSISGPGTQAQEVTAIQGNGSTAYYALGKDGKIYQMIQGSGTNGSNPYNLNSPLVLNPANTEVTSLVGAQSSIFALSQQVTNSIPGNYAIILLNPGSHAALQPVQTEPINLSLATNGQVPGLITAWKTGNNTFNVYVVLQSTANPNNATILSYSVDTKGAFSTPKVTHISVSEPVGSIAATPDQLFLLMENGDVLSLPITNQTLASVPVSVLTNVPIKPSLSADPQNFTASSTVPTVTSVPQTGSAPLKVSELSSGSQATLSAGMVTGITGKSQIHLFIGDQANHRVLDLTTQPLPPVATAGGAGGPGSTPTVAATSTANSQGSVTLYPGPQYVSSSYFNTIKGVAVDPGGSSIYILGQSAQNGESLAVVNTQNACPSS